MDRLVKKKLLGQYMTTPDIAIDMAQALFNDAGNPIIFDPACGEGELLIQAILHYRQNGVQLGAHQILGVDIDPEMVEIAKKRVGKVLACEESEVNISQGDFLQYEPESEICDIPLSHITQVIANPPYGKQREIQFFDKLNQILEQGTAMVLLMPLSFNDRIPLDSVEILSGRPLGVTTGHCIVKHEVGSSYEKKKVKPNQSNQTDFTVHNGLKIYEKGAGEPRQTQFILDKKPYSSESEIDGWMPCARTGDIQQFAITLNRLWIDYGPKLARPKNLELFQGPRIFLRRMPIWKGKKLACCYIENTAACAGDVLIIKHKKSDPNLLKGLAVLLNSDQVLDFIHAYRPSLKSRDSYPKIAAKDINALLDEFMITDEELLEMSKSYPNNAGSLKVDEEKTEDKGLLKKNKIKKFHPYIEFDFPMATVSRASSKEKSIRHGHPSTLQQWWARRPLAACRSTIFASLIPHPDKATKEELKIFREHFPSGDLVAQINNLISEISKWDNRHDIQLIGTAKKMIEQFNHYKTLTLIDSFAGGGSIPIEGLRLGLDTISNDLNSIACMNLSLVCELLPDISEDTIALFDEISDSVFEKMRVDLVKYFPSHQNRSSTTMWCWSFKCTECQNKIPLMNNLWLAKGKNPLAVHVKSVNGEPKFSLKKVQTKEEKTTADLGTVSKKGCHCMECGKKYSTDDLALLARSGEFEEIQYAKCVVDSSGKKIYEMVHQKDRVAYSKVPSDIFDEVPKIELDLNGIRHMWCIQYGRTTTSDLFNKRQLLVLNCLSNHISQAIRKLSEQNRDEKEIKAISALLCCLLNRLIVYNSRHSWWQSNGQFIANMFVRQGISMVWNYSEVYPLSLGAGGLHSAKKWIKLVITDLKRIERTGRVICGDAGNLVNVKTNSIDLGIIDPPYFDMITYSYLSDLFYAWNKPLLERVYPEFFKFSKPQRDDEAIVDRKHSLTVNAKTEQHFKNKMTQSFHELNRVLTDRSSLVVMFAHKKVDAWVSLLNSLSEAGFHISTVWPLHMERKNKFKGGKIDALSVACLIICNKNIAVKSASKKLETLEGKLRKQLQLMISSRIIGPDLSASFIPILLSSHANPKFHQSMNSGDFLSQLHREISNTIFNQQTIANQHNLWDLAQQILTDTNNSHKDITPFDLCKLADARFQSLVQDAINNKDSLNTQITNYKSSDLNDFLMTIQFIDSIRHSINIKSKEFDNLIAVIISSLIKN